MRLKLVILHILIILFTIINLDPHFASIHSASTHGKRAVTIIHYINDIFQIVLFHAASIIAIWLSQSGSSGLIRASGILVLTELLQTLMFIIEILFDHLVLSTTDICFLVLHHSLLLITMILTFLYAERLAMNQKSFKQVELLARNNQTVTYSQLKD